MYDGMLRWIASLNIRFQLDSPFIAGVYMDKTLTCRLDRWFCAEDRVLQSHASRQFSVSAWTLCLSTAISLCAPDKSRQAKTKNARQPKYARHETRFILFRPLSIDGVVFSFKSPYLDPSYIRSIIGINEVYVKIYARETHFYIKKSGLSPPAHPLKHAKRSCSAHAVNSRAVLCVKKLPLCLDNHSSLSRNCNYCAFVFSR